MTLLFCTTADKHTYAQMFSSRDEAVDFIKSEYFTHSDLASVSFIDTDTLLLGVTVPNGKLNVAISSDRFYPGVDIEYIPDDANEYPDESTLPRVYVEKPLDTNELSAMVWGDRNNEDYTHKITFS